MAATYAEVENHALHQGDPMSGTPGSITLRQNAGGARFYARQYYDYAGRKRDQYIAGQPGTPDTERLVDGWRARIKDANGLLHSVRLLNREGYATVTPRQFAALVPLASHELFTAGALLVGTHAFGAIVNRLGVRATSFATEDIDIARAARLALPEPPEGGLLGLLQMSGIDFVEIPPLDPRGHVTKYKEKGRSRFTFDLLVPAAGDHVEVAYVPELKTHATALPYFRYLLGESQDGIVMSSHGALAVRVPAPERFAIHKLIVPQLRRGRPEKSLKDLRQAATLIAALGELHPGALGEAVSKTAVSSRTCIRKSIGQIQPDLEPHPQAWAELTDSLPKRGK